VTGTIEITYLNYKVNSGLSDKIFKETESSISGGSPEGKSK